MGRRSIHLGLLVILLLSLGCRSGGIHVRSWDEAVAFTRSELAQGQGLADRLERYQRMTTRLSATIQALDRVSPAVEAVQRLRGVEIPLVGNGWQVLLALLSLATPDAARILDQLEKVLRALVEFKQALDGLESLPDMAAAVRQFEYNPNKRSLIDLAAACESTAPALEQLYHKVEDLLEPVKDVSGKLSDLLKGLRSASQAGIPIVSDAAAEAVEGIGAMEEPLLEIRDLLDQLERELEADLKLMERIQEATDQAYEHGIEE